MKHLLLTSFTILSFTFSHAQLQKGTMLLEGTFNVSGNSMTDEFNLFGGLNDFELRNNSIAIAPRIGWFTNNNLLLGVGLLFQNNTSKNFNFFNGTQSVVFITRNNLYSINPYFTKFSPLTDKLYLTTSVNVLIGFGSENAELGDQEQAADVFQAGLNIVPGLTYFISEKWGLQASIGQLFFQHRQAKLTTDLGQQQEDPKNTSNNFGLSFSANTYRIGFQYYLTRKKE